MFSMKCSPRFNYARSEAEIEKKRNAINFFQKMKIMIKENVFKTFK